ncbi:C1 family peptidase [Deinococcus sp. UYEF24]
MLKAAAFIVPLCLSLLVACGSSAPPTPSLSADHAYGAAAPALAQTLTPEEFQRRLDAGELTLTRADDAATRRTFSQGRQAQDLATLGDLPDKSDALQALLTDTPDAQPTADGDLLIQPLGTDGRPLRLLTLGTGTVAHALVGTQQVSQDPANALEVYRAAYRLLTPAQQGGLPTPDSLIGKSVTETRAAISSLDRAQAEVPGLDGVRSEVPGANGVKGLTPLTIGISEGQQPAAGNGTDATGVCAAPSPDGLLSRLRWPLKTFVSPVKDQANRGACWVFSSVGALESRALVTAGTSLDLSEQQFNNLRKLSSKDSDEGDWPRDALNDLAARGSTLAPESAWTYNPALSRANINSGQVGVCTNYSGLCSENVHQNPLSCTVNNGVTYCGLEPVVYRGGAAQPVAPSTMVWDNLHSLSPLPLNVVRTLLYNGTELILSFDTTRDFVNLGKGGYLTAVQGRSNGAHAVQVIGYIPDSLAPFAPDVVGGTGGGWFVIKNSWGCTWGDAGYGYLPVRFVQLHGYELDVLSMPSTRSAAFTSVRDALSAISPPPPVVNGVSLSGGPLDLYPGDSADFSAVVSGTGTIDPNVGWSLNPAVGTLSRTQGATVRYTAPAFGINADQRVTLTAVSVSDPGQSASTTFTLHPAVPASVKFSSLSSSAGTFTSFDPNIPTPVLNGVTVTAALQAGSSGIERLELRRPGALLVAVPLSPPLAAVQSGSATLSGDLTGLTPGPTTLILIGYDRTGAEVARAGLPVTVQASLPAIGTPSPGTLTLSAPAGSGVNASFTFPNTGTAPLTADVTPAAPWLTVLSNTPSPLAPGQTATVTVQASCPATPQVLNTTLLIASRDGLAPSQTANVSLTCTAPLLPVIGDPAPAVLNFSAAPGAAATGTFTFANTGAAPLSADIKIGSDSGWLTATSNVPSPLSPGQTATVTLQAVCPSTPQSLSTALTVTANDSRVSDRQVTVNLTCQNPSLPFIGEPSPAVLNLSGAVGAPATGTFTFTNTGTGPLSAEVRLDPIDSQLTVVSNAPSPLAPGQTAMVTLSAVCQAAGISTVGAQVTVTANDSRVPERRVTVNLTCADDKPLGIGVTSVSTQNVRPFLSATNPTVVLGRVTFSGTVQAGANPVESVQLISNGSVLSRNAFSLPGGAHTDYNTRLLDLDTSTIPNGLYTVTVRVVDSSGAFNETAPFVLRIDNAAGPSLASEIYSFNGVHVGPGQAPVILQKKFYKYDVNLFGGPTGYSGLLFVCLERGGGRSVLGQLPFGPQLGLAYPVPVGGVSPLELASNSDQIAVTDTSNGNSDALFISGNSACDIGPGSNLPSTSVIRVIFTN